MLAVDGVANGVAEMATEQLEAETCTLAAQLAAATCRFLLLIGELERREAWRSWGCRSLAHWLSWQCGIGLNAAREHVRVAVALHELPATTAAFAAGALSYSKVRALTRVASATAEDELIEFARVATAAQVETTVAAYRGVVRNVRPDQAAMRREQRSVRVLRNDDGTVTITARLEPEAATLLLAAIDAAKHEVPREEDVSAETLRADALEHVARRFLQPDDPAPPATEIVVHTDAQVTVGADAQRALMLSIDAVRALSCDAWVRHARDDDHAGDAGRRHRTVPKRLRRKVLRRDGEKCRFPGCTNRRYLHIHHLVHWTDGGPTDLDNLVALCTHHHTVVHRRHWRIDGNPNRPLTFVSPDGRVLSEEPVVVPPAEWDDVTADYASVTGDAINTAHGEHLDLDWTITALCCLIPPDRN